jgi:hypothetical protein
MSYRLPFNRLVVAIAYLALLTTRKALKNSESTANDTFNYWFPLLREMLPSSLLEQVKKTPMTVKLSKKYSHSSS